MKNLWLAVALFVGAQMGALAQGVMMLNAPEVTFFSSAPLEDIKATSKEAKGAVDFTKNEFLFRIPIKSFQFASALMQEHFNENYLESEKYPNGTFKGKLEGSYDLKKDGEYAVTAVGDLDIHGVSRSQRIPAKIIVKNGVASLYSKFMVKLADHKIEVPKLMFQKIAEQVEVTIQAGLRAAVAK
jgi:polyisoprenoid-binding protein YceI